LAIQFEHFKQYQRKPLENNIEQGAVVDEVEIPRKITLFRVLMERKLGIDWEHSNHRSVSMNSV